MIFRLSHTLQHDYIVVLWRLLYRNLRSTNNFHVVVRCCIKPRGVEPNRNEAPIGSSRGSLDWETLQTEKMAWIFCGTDSQQTHLTPKVPNWDLDGKYELIRCLLCRVFQQSYPV
jgi:hypothetical protein